MELVCVRLGYVRVMVRCTYLQLYFVLCLSCHICLVCYPDR